MKYKRDIQPQCIEEGFAIAAIFQRNCPPVVECTLWLASKHLGRDYVDFFYYNGFHSVYNSKSLGLRCDCKQW